MKYLMSLVLIVATSLSCLGAEPVFTNNYEEAIENKDSSVLVIFGSDWCGNCIKLKEDIDQFNLEDYVICIVDVEKRKDLGKEYKIRSYPTSIVMKNKKEISRKVGYRKMDFEKWIDQNRSK